MSAYVEFAKAMGAFTCAALFDIVKAYEGIRHQVLLRNARRYEFPLVVLRLLVLTYGMPRTVRVRKVATTMVRATKTVVPGCPCADLMMRLTVLPVLDALVSKFPSLCVAAVVDDIQFLSYGRPNETQALVSEASDFLIERFEEDGLNIDVTTRKLAILTPHRGSADKILRSMRRSAPPGKVRGNKLWRGARNLGIDFSVAIRSTAVRSARIKKAGCKSWRLRRVKKAGVATSQVAVIAKAGLNTVMLYGVGVTGMADSQIQRARSVVHRSMCPRPGKRSATADLFFARPGTSLDPALEATAAPVRYFVTASWENWCPRHVLARAFMHSKAVIDEKNDEQHSIWKIVAGPMGAAYASLIRVGSPAQGPFRW